MKQLRSMLAVSVVALSMVFAGGLTVSTNMNWADADGAATVSKEGTVLFGFNDNTSLGIDTKYGMLAVFNVTSAASLRLGWGAKHTIGVGYTFWNSGGEGVKTSLGASVNFEKGATPADDVTSIGMALGFSL